MPGLPEEQQKIVNWLNGPAGRAWSYGKYRQTCHAKQWFSFKPAVEGWSQADTMSDVVYVDLGWYNPGTRRYNSGPRQGYVSYRTGK